MTGKYHIDTLTISFDDEREEWEEIYCNEPPNSIDLMNDEEYEKFIKDIIDSINEGGIRQDF